MRQISTKQADKPPVDLPNQLARNSSPTHSASLHPPELQNAVVDSAELTKRWSLNVFRQVEAKLGENSTVKIQDLPLVFLNMPSGKDHFDDDMLTLDESSPLNTLAISFEQWLNHHHTLFNTFAHRYQQDPRLSLQISQITRKLEKESRLMKKVKILEWKRQLAATSKAGDCLVDTRAWFSHSLQLCDSCH